MATTSPFVTWLATLSSAGAVTASSNLLYIEQSGVSKKITPNDLIFGRVNTWTAAQTNSTAGVASTPPLYLTGAVLTGGTGTTNFPHVFFQPTGATASTTWSTAGTAYGANLPTGFTGNYVDFKLAGAATSALKVTSAGGIFTPSLSNTANQSSIAGVILESDGNGSKIRSALGGISFADSSPSVSFFISSSSLGVWVSRLGFGTGAGAYDIILERDAAAQLALRNGTTAQLFRVYSTYTDASNYERGALNAGGDYIELAAETAGTGDDNLDVRLTPAGTGNVRFGTYGAEVAAVSGYITIKDSGGTTRKLAVIA